VIIIEGFMESKDISKLTDKMKNSFAEASTVAWNAKKSKQNHGLILDKITNIAE
jgi:hypothetical protein